MMTLQEEERGVAEIETPSKGERNGHPYWKLNYNQYPD